MGRVFLIANHHLISQDTIETLQVTENDIVVLFNFMYLSYDACKNIKKKWVFLRVIHEPYGEDKHYLGGTKFLKHQTDFEKVVLVGNLLPETFDDFKALTHIPYVLLRDEQELPMKALNYSNGKVDKVPTTGFIAYQYIKLIMPEFDVILVGFTGCFADGTTPPEDHPHDYKWETEYYSKNSVKILPVHNHL